MSAARRYDDLTPETIEDALFSIPADLSREKWWRIGAALKSELGDAGAPLFHAWSRGAPSYNERDCSDTWKSTDASGGVGIATLIYEAQQFGFQLGGDRVRLSEAERQEREEARKSEARAAAARKREQHADAARRANLIWDAADRAPRGGHAYLADKGVAAHGLAVGDWPTYDDAGNVKRTTPGALIIPIADAKNGRIVSLQGIMSDPRGGFWKSYLKGGRKRGGFHMIGTPPGDGSPLAFAEGYATGAKVHELTGWPVIVTFDAPNVPVVAGIMREQFPHAAFMICADNDRFTTMLDGVENPGLHYAKQAAQPTRGFVLAPQFQSDEGQPTDWLDLAQAEGDEIARNQLISGLEQLVKSKSKNAESGQNTPGADLKCSEAATTAIIAGHAGKSKVSAGHIGEIRVPVPGNDNSAGRTVFGMGLDTNGRGTPRATIQNFDAILDNNGITVRRNIIAKRDEYNIPGVALSEDDPENDAWAEIKSRFNALDFPSGDFDALLGRIVRRNEHNPVADWILSQPWDGTQRLQSLLDTVKPANDRRLPDGRSLRDVLITRWLIGAVTAACNPAGVSGACVLSFTGKQYVGKTSWARQLLPGEMSKLFKDGLQLDPADKDSIYKAVSCFIGEIGEMGGTTRKSDRDALKAFITSGEDEIRLPYARRSSRWKRRTVFLGTVNDHAFLVDPTGNRRFWTVEVEAIDLEAQRNLDMQQVWAEVRALWDAGQTHFLTSDELAALNEHNEDFTAPDPITERIQARLDWQAPEGLWRWLTATEVLIEIGIDRPTRAETIAAGLALGKMNGARRRKSNGRQQLRVPPKAAAALDEGNWRPF